MHIPKSKVIPLPRDTPVAGAREGGMVLGVRSALPPAHSRTEGKQKATTLAPRRWLLPSASNDEKHWGVSFVTGSQELRSVNLPEISTAVKSSPQKDADWV